MNRKIALAPQENRKHGPIPSPWSYLIFMGLQLAGPATIYEIAEYFSVSPWDLLCRLDELIELNYIAE